MIFVQDFDAVGFSDIASRHNTRASCINCNTFRAFDFHVNRNAFEVQNDVGNVFTHTGNRGELVQYVINLHRRDGRALKRGQQNATKRVAECQTKAAL